MLVRVIVQKNERGEKHVTLTQDPTTPVTEFLLSSPGWENSTVVQGRVLLVLGMDEPDCVLDELVDTELHTAWTDHGLMPRVSIHSSILEALRKEDSDASA